MSNDPSSSDPVNPPTVPQRSAAIVNADGRWALYHETIYSPDTPETSYYVLELWTGVTTKLPKQYITQRVGLRRFVAIAVSGIGAGTTSAHSSVSEVDVLGYSSRPGGRILRCLVFRLQREPPSINILYMSGDLLEKFHLRYVPFPTRVSMGPKNFDISKAGLALVAQTEEQSQAQHDGIFDVYFIPFDQLPTPRKLEELIPIKIRTTGITGSASVPVLNPGSFSWLAFLKRNDNSTERGETFIFRARIKKNRADHPFHSVYQVQPKRALPNGSTDLLIYNAETGERSMVQRASIGEVMTEQNQDDGNEIGGNFEDLTEDGIIEDGIIEDREGIINEGNGPEDGIVENREDSGNESNDIEDREEVINENKEEVVNMSNDIEDREEVINESNSPEDGIIENREEFGDESEDESEDDPLEPPFPVLENRGGQWLEERRRRGLAELSL
ncbi:uncharacterized protein EAE98_006559 [Botrytis deweyae]|uniref:Histone chaperone RTT106/FACT complex subunit SPT16-like middle domain-containing protein n=1 Tax=Botrytis deweyae TaxID=2478750 RepID=A0ABQ7IJN9_9HELO|nr:uncharacterized protein EAE98_006559 [Botrytis deweyae]KAF7926264.1 hypothetical protein EAE98_006559 [Botrytis deweyae]